MKTYSVQAMTQYGNTWQPARRWCLFKAYEAKNKSDAIAKARFDNRQGDCLAGLGLVWWKAIEQ